MYDAGVTARHARLEHPNLQHALDRLLQAQGPAPGDIVIIERTAAEGEPWIVDRARLRSAAAYAPRFADLLNRGFDWLNVSYYGQLEGRPLVVVEVPPGDPTGAPRTSINFSGPTRAVTDAGGDAAAVVTLVSPGGG